MHLDATEHNGELVFLHAVKPGPANQSYGLQVAALAGVPKGVITRAKSYLKKLESEQFVQAENPQVQLPLTMNDDKNEELRSALEELEPDTMSPRDALDALYRLKEHL